MRADAAEALAAEGHREGSVLGLHGQEPLGLPLDQVRHELAAHHMEIRGIGLIDIPALFGVRAVRQQKRIEVVVQLEDWETAKDSDRSGRIRRMCQKRPHVRCCLLR